MCRTILAVILYDKDFADSHTLSSLMNKNHVDLDLVIINNGPKHLESDIDFIKSLGSFVNDIDYKEFVDNRPLSWIYNGLFREYNEYDRYILLDDDSIVSEDYINKCEQYYTDDVDIQLPNIRDRVSGGFYYPKINKKVQKISDGEIINYQSYVISIGSGLVIYRSLIEKFFELNMELFDTRFALYGVDYSLFHRIESLKKLKVKVTIQVVGTFEHSLSRVGQVDSEWRIIERLYDSVLSVKYYSRNKYVSLVRLLKISCYQLIKFRFSSVSLIVKIFTAGKHPRC